MTDPGPLVDHHCHGLVTEELDRQGFESLMNEAEHAASGTSLFDSMLGLAIRRWCAPVLDLEPHTPPEEYLARRSDLGAAEVNRRFVTEAGIATFLVDTGLVPDRLTSPQELAAIAGGTSHEVIRLEAVAEAALDAGIAPKRFADHFEELLRTSRAVAFKSIAAYRVGLGLPAAPPTRSQLVAALREVGPDGSGHHRIAHPVVNAWLAWVAIDAGRPLQFHVGYGDADIDLADCDPLRLTEFLRATQDRGVPVMLLHNYPFHRNAGYLAQVFDHVFIDVGLATHNSGALSVAPIRESLEIAPFAKVLFSSDAFGLAELYHLGALLFRHGISAVLDGLVEDGQMAASDAQRIAQMIGRENAARAYRIEVAGGAG